MPTGYTADVQDGTITDFPTFAMRCARAFGALVMMRDDPLNAPITPREPNSFYGTKLAQARKHLAEVEALTAAQAQERADAEYAKRCAERKESEERCRLHSERYEAMLAHVEAWEPPTDDHQNLKKFMRDQLLQSIEYDCVVYPEPPKHLTGDEWLAIELASVKWDIEFYERKYAEDRKNAEGSNEWVAKLRESLGHVATAGRP